MRLDRFLAENNLGTRSNLKKDIKNGLVKVNGETIFDVHAHINEEEDIVSYDGFEITYQKYTYWMINKPKGTVCTSVGEDSILNYIPQLQRGYFCSGRVDKDTEGLLFIMNDGSLSHSLLSPKNHIEKEYYVELEKPISDEDIKRLEKGITTKHGTTFMPAKIIKKEDKVVHIIVEEGKFHEIKRLFQACDNEVTYLKRLRIKNIWLDENLKPGEARLLTEEEIMDLKK